MPFGDGDRDTGGHECHDTGCDVCGLGRGEVEARYRGKVVLLTGPQMSSAGYLIARDFKASGAATLIGRLR